MPQSDVNRLLQDIDLNLDRLVRDSMWERMMGRDTASIMEDMAFQHSADMGYLQDEMAYALDDLRRDMRAELQRIVKAFKASQLPPLAAEAKELMDRAKDNKERGLYQEALEDLLRAEEKEPYDFRLQTWLGAVYLEHFDDAATALGHYERAVRYARPRSQEGAAWALLGVSRCKAALGDTPGAYEASKEALSLDPAAPSILYTHAAHCAQNEEAEEALAAIEQAIGQSPIYFLAAEQDPRFEPLGDALPQRIEKIHARARSELQAVAGKSARLEQVVSGWRIPPADFEGEAYRQLRAPLQGLEARAASGSYVEHAALLETVRGSYPKLVRRLDEQLSHSIDAAGKKIASCEKGLQAAQERGGSLDMETIGATLPLAGWLAVSLVTLLLLTWSCSFVSIDTIGGIGLNLLKLLGLAMVVGLALLIREKLPGAFRKASDQIKARDRALGHGRDLQRELPEARARLEVLREQQQSLAPFR